MAANNTPPHPQQLKADAEILCSQIIKNLDDAMIMLRAEVVCPYQAKAYIEQCKKKTIQLKNLVA